MYLSEKDIYDKLMRDISVSVLDEINEAYDNALLEKFDFFEFWKNNVMMSDDDWDEADKMFKKLIVYILKKFESSNQYKKALQFTDECKTRINKYMDKHKQITPRLLFKIIVTALAIYGGVSFINLCKPGLQTVYDTINTETAQQSNNVEDQVAKDSQSILDMGIPINTNHDEYTGDNAEDSEYDDDIDKPSTGHLLPKQIFSNDNNYKFIASKSCQNFIKKHEILLLYPYYATKSEEARGIITIGYGHVVLKEDGDLYNKCQLLRKKGLIKQSYVTVNGRSVLNPNHCKNIITLADADNLFNKDIKIAEKRAYKAITSMKTDLNVKCYMLYNQGIIDGLTSLCYNAGGLKQSKYSFIKNGLAKCRYDYKHNCINKNDYNVSFSFFKNIKDNPNRRNEEYKLFFLNANKPLLQFKTV